MILYTIGIYGFTRDAFVQALREAHITSLIDIRRRRGVRGSMYRFANATALQSLLLNEHIAYLAEPNLAPSETIRNIQKEADKQMKLLKRKRDHLEPTFEASYNEEILGQYSDEAFANLISQGGERPCLLCVERLPAACHRHLAAQWIVIRTGISVIHLLP